MCEQPKPTCLKTLFPFFLFRMLAKVETRALVIGLGEKLHGNKNGSALVRTLIGYP